jgi:hypothetical protein
MALPWRASRHGYTYLAMAVVALAATATAAAVSMRGGGESDGPTPYDVAAVKRAFAARGENARVPAGGVALGWSCDSPDGYRAFLEGGGSWYAVVFQGPSSASAWEECLAERTPSQWSYARRANVVVVSSTDEAPLVRAVLAELP